MNKNLFLRLCLMMTVMLMLFSCKSDLLDDAYTDTKTQNLIVRQLKYEELQKHSPVMVDKLSRFQKRIGIRDNSRTYTDSEEEFSIDTEKSL